MYLDAVQQAMRFYALVPDEEIVGCTPEQIAALEQAAGAALPAAYTEFLLWMGQGAGALFRGTDVFYQDIVDLHEGALALLEENHFPEPLPADAFVFYMHQGYQFMYFRLFDEPDPPIWYFGEGEELITFVRLYAHFSDFLQTEVEGYARAWGKRK